MLQNFEHSTHNWSSQEIYVLMILTMRTAVIWDLPPWRLVGVYRHVRGYCCLCHQDREVVGLSETSVIFYQAMWHHIPEDSHLRTSLQFFVMPWR